MNPLRPLLSTLAAAALGAAAHAGQPVPGINIALALDDREVSATTTLEDGAALLLAEETGEYSLVLQSPLPERAELIALVGLAQEESAVILPAGLPSRDAALSFPARAGDQITVRMETVDAEDREAR